MGFRRWLIRLALNRTAGYLERHEGRVLAHWTRLVQADLPSAPVRHEQARLAAGRENLRLLVAALRAQGDQAQQQQERDLLEWADERARLGLVNGLALHDLLQPLGLFRTAVQRNVQRMLTRQLWLAVPSDVLLAVSQINAAIDRQMLAIAQAYVAARDVVIRGNDEALERSNRQLILLNQEMQHRVKNNLQTIADLLSLEITSEMTKPPAEYLRESLNRVKCIAAVHELLTPDNAQTTDATSLARRVADIAVRGLAGGRAIRVSVSGPGLPLPAKAATSLALVLNELVNNSLEHGFRGRNDGRIAVTLERTDESGRLLVEDDGIGLPADFDLDRDQNLGLRIVRALVSDDLKGTMAITNGSGTRATVTFPLEPQGM